MVAESLVLAFLLVASLLTAWREPRRLLPGVLLTLTLLVGLGLAVAAVGRTVLQLRGNTQAGWTLLGGGAACLVAILILGLWLMLNGLTLIRREGFGLSMLLSFGMGLLLVGYVVALAVGLALDRLGDSEESLRLILILFTVTFPAGYLSLVFIALLLWSVIYGWWGRFRGRRARVDAVIVLGAGLLGGERVGPLLGARLDRGREVYDAARAAGRSPVIICSGGQGDDEKLSEAEAMARYLIDRGVDPADILREDRSTDTAENLRFSREVLAAHDITGPAAVATSNYHALRAATLMRTVGVSGFSVGAPTAFYYVPNAMVREYLALLRDQKWLTTVMLLLLCVPLVLVATGMIVGAVRP